MTIPVSVHARMRRCSKSQASIEASSDWVDFESTGENRGEEYNQEVFLVAGITIGSSEEELARDDSTYREIQQIMTEVFVEGHMGYVEPSEESDEDPFASCSSNSESESESTHLAESDAEEKINADS
jgi:hypothetical protein